MPIKSCKLPDGGNGYQWGDHGTCYADRADAEKQAEAAHANGYAGDKLPMGIARAADRFAFDRSTVRTIDVDGRMHVEISPISKANVCPYYGREIPNSEALGLKPDQVYQLLRDPVELAKAAPTFNNIQLMQAHVPVNATDTQKMDVVGCTGSDATFTPPYLTNSLCIWDASAIAGIDSGEQRELSSSYRYVADMNPGEFEGVPYDGRMTQIVGNHVALVPAGRAGADVLVGDSLPTELNPMKQSNRAVAMRAAAGAYLRPLLASDGAIDLSKLKAIVKGNKRPEFVAMDIKSVFKTADIDAAKLTDVLRLAADESMDDEDDDKAEDEDEETEEEKKARLAKDDKKADDEDDEDDEDEDDKKANDAALVARGRTEALREFKAIRDAEKAVQPLVGEVVAMDSAEAVYRYALDSAGVDHKDVHASALPALVKLAAQAKTTTAAPRVAMDAAASDDFRKRFPTASPIARA